MIKVLDNTNNMQLFIVGFITVKFIALMLVTAICSKGVRLVVRPLVFLMSIAWPVFGIMAPEQPNWPFVLGLTIPPVIIIIMWYRFAKRERMVLH